MIEGVSVNRHRALVILVTLLTFATALVLAFLVKESVGRAPSESKLATAES